MNRYWLILLGALLGLAAAAPAVEDISVIYNGDAQLSKRIVMGFWGYRPVAEEEGNPFKPIRLVQGRKIYGLNITSLGRYQGVRFDFQDPLDITAIVADKAAFLELYIRATTPQTAVPTAAPAAGSVLPPRLLPGEAGGPAMGGPAMGGPIVATPADSAAFPPELLKEVERPAVSSPLPALKNIRFSFFTEKGEGLLVVTPDQFYPKEEINKYWIRVGIPLSMLNKALPVGGKLSRIVITSDEPAMFLLGRMAFVRDTDPIVGSMFIYPPFLAAKDRIFFAARVEAGLTPYQVEWSFDAAKGAKVDAVGDRVTYIYDKEGNYKITCTVRDKTGAKAPVTSTIEVKLSPPEEQ